MAKKSKKSKLAKKVKQPKKLDAAQKLFLVLIAAAIVLLVTGFLYIITPKTASANNPIKPEIKQKIDEVNGELAKQQEEYVKKGLKVIYAGYKQQGDLGNPEGYTADKVVDYGTVNKEDYKKMYLNGQWMNNSDNFQYQDDAKPDGYVSVVAYGMKVQAELSSADENPAEAEVLVNGLPVKDTEAGSSVFVIGGKSYIKIKEMGGYNILNAPQPGVYEIRILPMTRNFRVYSFTFN